MASVYDTHLRLDQNPIVISNFNPSSIDFGTAELEVLEGGETGHIKSSQSGPNSYFNIFKPKGGKLTITVPRNSEEGKRLYKSIDNYIKTSEKNGYSEYLQVSVSIFTENIRIVCQDGSWGRPNFQAGIKDPDNTMKFELFLPNYKEEAIA